jgi:hypothetical protein
MNKTILALAALVVIGLTGTAFAEEGKSTTAGPAVMNDSEMDAVTAGAPQPCAFCTGEGLDTAKRAGGRPQARPNGLENGIGTDHKPQ